MRLAECTIASYFKTTGGTGLAAGRCKDPDAHVVLESAEPAFIFPVVGSAGVFSTEAVLVNRQNRTRRLNLHYLPLGAWASNCNKPGRALDMAANQMLLFSDFVGRCL